MHFSEREFSHPTGQKHRKIQCFCFFAILIFNFCFLACCKNIVNTMVLDGFGLVCGLPDLLSAYVRARAARARARQMSQYSGACLARARRACVPTKHRATTTTTTTTTNSHSLPRHCRWVR